MSLRRIRQFITGDAKRLSSQLSELEGNVAAECDDIRATYVPSPVPRRVTSGGGIYGVGQALICDTAAASFSIVLEPPDAGRSGLLLLVVMSANPVVVATLAGAINESTLPQNFAGGTFWLFWDPTTSNWWST